MKPDFLIIGAQKCATTWLHYHLRKHPALFMPEDKDFEFFSYSGNLNKAAFERWCARFSEAPAGHKAGDANAAYFWTGTGSPWSEKPDSFNPEIPRSIHRFLGAGLHLIISLRDPVERAVSAYLHHIVHGSVSPEERIEDVTAPLGIIDMGLYGAHLENWLDSYPAEQMLLINGLPQGQNGGRLCLNKITAFLGVDTFPETHAAELPVFAGVPRNFQEDGVWVAAEHPLIARHLPLKRTAPLECMQNGNFIRLVERAELLHLETFYQQDQRKLAGLLADNHIHVLTPASILELNYTR